MPNPDRGTRRVEPLVSFRSSVPSKRRRGTGAGQKSFLRNALQCMPLTGTVHTCPEVPQEACVSAPGSGSVMIDLQRLNLNVVRESFFC